MMCDMNLVEMWVTNITYHEYSDGLHCIVADFNCYGRKENQVTKYLTEYEWLSVKFNGYYLV